MEANKIVQGDCLTVLKTLPSECIDMVITSPPYWALRDYGVAGQLGLEPTFEEYITKLCDIFDEVKRVLKKDGTCWVNLGDTYAGSGGGRNADGTPGKSESLNKNNRGTMTGIIKKSRFSKWQSDTPDSIQRCHEFERIYGGLKCKSLCQIPSRFSIEMTNRGWILRNEIIWHKPNCMPHSIKDRFTVDFEKIFFFSKSKKYFFEQQLEDANASENKYRQNLRSNKAYDMKYEGYKNNFPIPRADGKRNKRCVWSITTKPFKDAHFAVFPEALVETPIRAGCPEFVCSKCGEPRYKLFKRIDIKHTQSETKYDVADSTAGRLAQKRQAYREMGLEGPPAPEFAGYSDCKCGAEFKPGIVLDPFIGSGTTAVVARRLGRSFLGIELNPEYIEIANRRMESFQNNLIRE